MLCAVRMIKKMGMQYPVITLYLLQVLTGLALVGIVGLIALAGGSVIWILYQFMQMI